MGKDPATLKKPAEDPSLCTVEIYGDSIMASNSTAVTPAMRLQQIRVEPGHASRMLGTAFLDKAAERKAIKKNARLGRRKILAVIRTAPT